MAYETVNDRFKFVGKGKGYKVGQRNVESGGGETKSRTASAGDLRAEGLGIELAIDATWLDFLSSSLKRCSACI